MSPVSLKLPTRFDRNNPAAAANRQSELSHVYLRYKPASNRRMLFVIAALSPIWLAWIPVVLYSLGTQLFTGHADFALLVYFVAALTVALLMLLGVWGCLDYRISINENGIAFPLRLRLHCHFRRSMPWSQLKAIVYKPCQAKQSKEQLILQFADCVVPLVTSAFSKEDLRKLVLATHTHCQSTSLSEASFTQMWEKEYQSRFAPTAFVPLEPGARLKDGEIEIVQQMAAGGLSAVYTAHVAGEPVTVKELMVPLDGSDLSDKATELFQREARLLKQLNHRRVAKVMDSFEENGRHYIVMEHIPGIDLRSFIKESGQQHEQVVLRWAIEIAEVLFYLHTRTPAVLHRDLTPDNLIFTDEGTIAVIDFGAANTFIAQTTGTLIGKQNYISPEQFRGYASAGSDIYALGGTMFFLLTGRDSEPLTVAHPGLFNDQVSQLTDALVARATAQNVNERIASTADLLSSLRATLRGLNQSVGNLGV